MSVEPRKGQGRSLRARERVNCNLVGAGEACLLGCVSGFYCVASRFGSDFRSEGDSN